MMRTRSRRYLRYNNRDRLGLNAWHRIRLREINKNIRSLLGLYEAMEVLGESMLLDPILTAVLTEYRNMIDILYKQTNPC